MFAVVVTGWLVVLALILRHRIFVSHDSVSNYAHVWYVADHLRHAHSIPFRMPIIGHGDGLAFPYAFLPWVTAGIAWLALGSWAVTLWLVIGCVGAIVATFWACPELGDDWLGIAALLNPAVVAGAIIGQLPFMWASALLLAGIGCWRRSFRWQAAVLVGLAQATHAAVVLPIGIVVVAAWLPWERERRRLLKWYARSLAISVPAALLVEMTPAFGDTSLPSKVANLLVTLVVRVLIVAVPIFLVAVGRSRFRVVAPVLAGLGVVANVALFAPLSLRYAWTALDRNPDKAMLAFVDSPAFVKGQTYRVLRAGDGKIGMYQVMVNGGRLDSEFFPESIARKSFGDVSAYSSFLRARKVDAVIVWDTYDRQFRTDEHRLLDQLTAQGCSPPVVGARVALRLEHATMYAIDRSCGKP